MCLDTPIIIRNFEKGTKKLPKTIYSPEPRTKEMSSSRAIINLGEQKIPN
jgi:hypothetical protein